MSRKLPPWLTRKKDGVFVVNPDGAYPFILGHIAAAAQQELAGLPTDDETFAARRRELGVLVNADKRPDQYLVETAYQCTKLLVQKLVENTELDPRPKMVLTIHIIDTRDDKNKSKWSMKNFLEGRGIAAATKGREAVAQFNRLEPRLMASLST